MNATSTTTARSKAVIIAIVLRSTVKCACADVLARHLVIWNP
ncbi:MAG TPA: hypothetical protein VGD53_27495 [Actinoallomurus sp.]|jgi:hypothetical protein